MTATPPLTAPRRRVHRLLAAGLAATLVGCAGLRPTLPEPGQTEAEAVARLAPLTGRHAMPDGTQRLEFARGPYGRQTWMVDLDAGGRVLRTVQVLTEANFQRVHNGMPRDELLRLLGRPADVQREFQNRQTWSWRYPTNDCLWARVTLDAQGYVRGGASLMLDPSCDLPAF